MKSFNSVGVITIALLILIIIFNLSHGEFRSNSSIILARSMTITSTIEGKIVNKLPKIGQNINKNDLLVSINNNRLDKSRMIRYQTEINQIKSDIKAYNKQKLEIEKLLTIYKKRAKYYKEWMIEDTKLIYIKHTKQLIESEKISALNTDKAKMINSLFKNEHASSTELQQANAREIIARNKVDLNLTQLKRSKLLLDSITNNNAFFENGEASYWIKMLDTMALRKLDVTSKLLSLNSKLTNLKIQEKIEKARIDSSFNENISSPFKGVVSSIYVSAQSNITSGTNLLQVSDCSNPLVIIPIPEYNLSAFSVGMRVSITPIDSSKTLSGKISYISSGPMLASDKTMILQNDMTINGTKAIATIDKTDAYNGNSETCDISRKAMVVIHT